MTFFAPTPRGLVASADRGGSRYAAPKMPLQRPAAVFRPDAREPASSAWGTAGEAAADQRLSALHAQFRPTEKRRKRTYEETQAAAPGRPGFSPRMAPSMAYGVPPLSAPPPYPGYWRQW